MNTNQQEYMYEDLEVLGIADSFIDVVCPNCNGGGCVTCEGNGALTLDLSNTAATPIVGGCYERI